MKTIKPINIENQLFDVLEGKPQKDIKARDRKIKYVSDNIQNVIKVNGKKVFNPIVIGKDIYYNLQKAPDWMEIGDSGRKYYYPIEYAEITIQN